jgi:murein L,D-transpeptidase YcbB/YkuD
LSDKLNRTYIAYGSAGRSAKARQAAQDQAAASVASEVAVQRAVTKSAPQYRSESWDLVAAKKSGGVKLEQLKAEELPPEMAGMNEKQRVAYVDAKEKERQQIQTRIQTLQAERQKHLEAGQKQASGQTLDAAIIKALRSQASSKGYVFQ